MPRTGPFGWGNRVGQQDPQGQHHMWCPASKCSMELSSRCWSGHSGCGTMQAEGAQKCHFLYISFTVAFSCQRCVLFICYSMSSLNSATRTLLLPLQIWLELCFPYKPSSSQEALLIWLVQGGKTRNVPNAIKYYCNPASSSRRAL